MDRRRYTCCFSGHRNIKASDIPDVMKRTEEYIRLLVGKGVTLFEVGGALGYDTLAAELLFRLRSTDLPQIKVCLVYPFEGFTNSWNEADRTKYSRLLPKYDEVIRATKIASRESYLLRDRILVDHSAYCICYCTRKTGGTAYTVRYAQKQGIKVLNVAEKGDYISNLEKLIEKADVYLEGIKAGYAQRPVLYYGQYGVGKTRLLDSINATAETRGIKCYRLKADGNEELIPQLIHILSGAEYHPNGLDLTELMVKYGKVARQSGSAICLLIDDIHRLSCRQLQELLAAQHRCNQLRLPVIIFCTGLPITKKLMGTACSYAERMFIFETVENP